MRSATKPAPQDLTAEAQIRDAAIKLFAEHGYNGTAIRAIAAEAGVSPALVALPIAVAALANRDFGTG